MKWYIHNWLTKYTHSAVCTKHNQMIEMKRKKHAEIIRIPCCVLTDNYIVCSCVYLLFDRRCDELECDESKTKNRSGNVSMYLFLFFGECEWMIRPVAITFTTISKRTHEMITVRLCGRLCESENRKMKLHKTNRKMKCHSHYVPDDVDLRAFCMCS